MKDPMKAAMHHKSLCRNQWLETPIPPLLLYAKLVILEPYHDVRKMNVAGGTHRTSTGALEGHAWFTVHHIPASDLGGCRLRSAFSSDQA